MESIDHITRDLQSQEEDVRRFAVERLKEVSHPEALALLYDALGDSSWRVRKSAVQALVNFPDTGQAVHTLIDALYDGENVGRRTGGVEGLVALNDRALDGVIRAMKTEDAEVRKFLVDIMGELKAPRSLDTLLESVNDTEENIRLAAIEALGNLGGDKVYKKLLGFLDHADITIVFASLHALGRMNREIPLPVIRNLMGRKILRRALFEVLGQSGNEEAMKILAGGLAESSKSARQAALRSLFKIYKRSVGRGGANHMVEEEIRSRMSGRPIDGIGELLQSDHAELKRSAAWILGVLADAEALHYLVDALDDDTIQGDVVKALSEVRTENGDMFQQELKRYDPEMQKRVSDLLKDIAPGVAARKGVPRPTEMTVQQFTWLRDSIANFGGLNFDLEMKYVLERRLAPRLKETRCRDFGEYIKYLKRPEVTRDELERITGDLSTKETYFFREEFQLRAFREEIMPALLERKERSRDSTIRLWSAGCSTGEEPYTMAMLVREMKLSPRWKVQIYASDISGSALDVARTGVYSGAAFRVMDDYYLHRYFTKLNGKYQISRGILSMVELSKLNILECRNVHFLQSLDVIFCRNVIIYFNQDKKRRLVEDFHHLLADGGYLLLGHSESLMNLSTSFKLLHLKNDLVYQKPSRRRR